MASCSTSYLETAKGHITTAAAVRAALYLRVSTGRQADNDLSIPDQRRQAKAYCASRGWEIAADYIEPGASATDDRRPEFQRMIDAATAGYFAWGCFRYFWLGAKATRHGCENPA